MFEINAVRTNKNHWAIDEESLSLWISKTEKGGRAHPDAHQNAHPDIYRELICSLQRENVDLRCRAEAAERDRDAWRDQAKRDQEALHEGQKRWRWWWFKR